MYRQVMQTLRRIQAQQYALLTWEFYGGGRQASCSPGNRAPYPSEPRRVSLSSRTMGFLGHPARSQDAALTEVL